MRTMLHLIKEMVEAPGRWLVQTMDEADDVWDDPDPLLADDR